MINFKKIQKLALDCAIFCSQSRHTLIAMYVAQNLKYGVMRIKHHVKAVVLNGNDPTKMQLVYHTVNMQTNAEQ
jgi:hypothetical protein